MVRVLSTPPCHSSPTHSSTVLPVVAVVLLCAVGYYRRPRGVSAGHCRRRAVVMRSPRPLNVACPTPVSHSERGQVLRGTSGTSLLRSIAVAAASVRLRPGVPTTAATVFVAAAFL